MGQKVKEIAPASLSAKACDPEKGGCCSNHRRKDRVYEDEIVQFMHANPGVSPWKDPENPPQGQSDFRP
jgi:hypothetical protein